MAGRPLQLDTSAKHGPWSAALSASGAALSTTAITDVVGSPVYYVPTAALFLGIIVFGISLMKKLSRGAALWRMACWFAAGGWSAYARTHEAELPFGTHEAVWWANAENWYLAVVLMILGGITAGTMAFRERHAADRAAKLARKEALASEGRDTVRDERARAFRIALAEVSGVGRYEARLDPETGKPYINQATGKPIKVLTGGAKIRAVEEWPELHGRSHGYTIDGDMPPGMTYENITNLPGLASYLGLPKGCGIEVDEGNTGRNSFIAQVQTHNAFIHNYPYPDELVRPHTAEEDTPSGVKLDGTIGTIPMRYDNVTMAGEPDAGKSNATHVLGIFDVTAYDALLIDIDLTKSLSVPYIEPWFNAQMSGDPDRMAEVPAPAVAITCPNRPIAWFVTECGVELVNARKSGYRKLIRNMKLPIARTPEDGGVPLLRWRVDEGGAFGDGNLLSNLVRENINQIAGQGRPAAMRTQWGGLRGVDEFIPSNLNALSMHRIALRPTKAQELGYYFGWSDLPDIKRAQAKGQAYVKIGNAVPFVERFYMVGNGADLDAETHVAQIAEKAAPWQPVLDPLSVAVFNAPRLVDDEEAIAFFKGGPGVTENEDGTVTVENFWDNRWEFILPELFPDEYQGTRAKRQPVTAGATAAATPRAATSGGKMSDLSGASRALTNSTAAMNNAQAALDEAVREANRRADAGEAPEYSLFGGENGVPEPGQGGDGGNGTEDGEPADDAAEIARLNALLEQPLAKVPDDPALRRANPPEPQAPGAKPGAPTPKEQTILVLRIIGAAGEDGIMAGEARKRLNAVLSRWDIEVKEQQFYPNRLKKLVEPVAASGAQGTPLIEQPWGPGPGAEPKGRWVITEAGRQFLAQHG